ncbi:MAG: C69 family dipeptidase [Saprospiraceae bacterium]|nr:C69 family dipeptidase [Saprospiraceae bacterium]MCB9325772.1 C69 family dipeptidase [Lewinellaceae bacterium]
MCDTFVVLPKSSADQSVIFGKNSDREPNEMQSLEYHAGRQYSKGAVLPCTYLTIPQVEATRSIIIGRPFWMWGAEFGVNDKGVVIGNEAVWTKMKASKNGGLTGMDLLRLGLERGDSALHALEIITELLAPFGQGGICGYHDKSMTYHNSYLIADATEAWVLETSGPLWAAKKVETHYAISNRLSIGSDIDLQHEDLIDYARKKGWLKKGRDFHFADCYSDWLFSTFSGSGSRATQSTCYLDDHYKAMSVEKAMQLLRSHPAQDYEPDKSLLGNSICAHAANPVTRNATQTTGSMIVHLKDGQATHWFTGTSAPCLSIFKPVWFGAQVLPELGPPGPLFSTDNFWWRHEQLHRLTLPDFLRRKALYSEALQDFQSGLIHKTQKPATGNSLFDLTYAAFEEEDKRRISWLEKVGNFPVGKENSWFYRRYWSKQNKNAKIPVR